MILIFSSTIFFYFFKIFSHSLHCALLFFSKMSFTAETTTVSAITMVSAASNNTATATGESSTDSTDSNTPPLSTQEYLLSIENTEEYSAILHAMSTCLPDAKKSTALLATLIKNKSIQKKSTKPTKEVLFNEIFRRDPTMKMSSIQWMLWPCSIT